MMKLKKIDKKILESTGLTLQTNDMGHETKITIKQKSNPQQNKSSILNKLSVK
jgi:hypothetical protein